MQKRSLRSILDPASAHVEHAVERIESELQFAEELCWLHPEESGSWRPLISRARELVSTELGARRLDGIEGTVAEAEGILAPIATVARSYTVHCAGHAHIDMNWMWSWPETVAVTIDTFSTVLRLMDQYPEFCFSQSQASTYAIVEEHRPDMLERIARRVKEGRWEVTASHWVEGDKNLANPESLCRHLLYTREYVQRVFGLSPDDVPIDWSPDTFGHPVTVPTYLSRGAVKYLYMHRPGGLGHERPWLFWWMGPDGSRILVRNDSNSRYAYNGVVKGEIVCRDLCLFARETGLRDHLFIYGVGDHGGGPTRRDIHQVLEMRTWPIFPTVRFSTVKAYMDLIHPQAGGITVLDCELNCEFAGCYTSQSVIKRANRFGENRLLDAEAAATVAWAAAGLEYPAERLKEGWKDTLFNHFHDILPGSGVHDTRTYTHGLYQKTVAMTSQVEAQALRQLASRIDTSGAGCASGVDLPSSRMQNSAGAGVGFRAVDGGLSQSDQSLGEGDRPFVLFNPTAHDREEIVVVTIWANDPPGAATPLKSRSFAVRAADGTTAPAQVTGGGGFWGHDYATVAFPAKVSGLGYASYIVAEAEETAGGVTGSSGSQAGASPAVAHAAGVWQTGRVHHCPYAQWERSPEGLENEKILLELDPTTGGIQRLLDKESGLELVTPEGNAPALEYVVERPHGMTAWLVGHQGAPAEHPVVRELRRSLDGPHKAAIEVDLRIHESDLTLSYELRAGDPALYVGIKGTWFQRGTPEIGVPVLNFVLPLALEQAKARYEIPFGAIDRDLSAREEVPTLQWSQVTGLAGGWAAGCLLLNDSKHGHSLEGSTMRLTLIRSSYDPDILPEIGSHEIHLALVPFGGELPVSGAVRQGQAFNRPLRVVSTDVHSGEMPPSGRFLRVKSERAVVSGIKRSEDGGALVLRLYNPTRDCAAAGVEVDRELMGRVTDAVETDLLERPLDGSAASVAGNTVSVSVPARGIATVRVGVQKG